MMYHNPQAVVQVNGRRSGVIAIERSVRQGCPLSPLLYVLALEPLLRRLRDEGTSPALRGIPFVAALRLGFPRSLMTSQCLYPAARI